MDYEDIIGSESHIDFKPKQRDDLWQIISRKFVN